VISSNTGKYAGITLPSTDFLHDVMDDDVFCRST